MNVMCHIDKPLSPLKCILSIFEGNNSTISVHIRISAPNRSSRSAPFRRHNCFPNFDSQSYLWRDATRCPALPSLLSAWLITLERALQHMKCALRNGRISSPLKRPGVQVTECLIQSKRCECRNSNEDCDVLC